MKAIHWDRLLLVAMTLLPTFSSIACKKKPVLQQSSIKELPLDSSQKLMDFDVAVNYFKQNYAPLKYKEQRLGAPFEPKFAALRAEVEASTTDEEFQWIMTKLIALFQDGHVSIKFPKRVSHTIPLTIDLIDGKYIIIDVGDKALKDMGINRGDEVLTIDGQAPDTIVQRFSQYSNDGHEGYNARMWAYYLTTRNFVKPASDMSMFKIKRHKDGVEWDVPLAWKSETIGAKGISAENRLPSPGYQGILSTSNFETDQLKSGEDLPRARDGLYAYGAVEPFFLTDKVLRSFSITKVELTDTEWKEGLPEGMTDKPMPVFAGLYRYQGKSILLLRVASHHIKAAHVDNTDMDIAWSIRTYSKILAKYSSLADVLVIDQNYNPGGYVKHVEELTKIFLAQPGVNVAFAPRADRMWLTNIATHDLPGAKGYEKTVWETLYRRIDEANEKGEHLAAPIWFSTPRLVGDQVWSKPILMLINEMDASGGDAFPLLMKENRRATLFGKRTSGMGGNVEKMPPLPNSGATIALTRSLFFISDSENNIAPRAIIENNGVSPDIEHHITIDDFHADYTGYVEAFSQAAVSLVPAADTTPSSQESTGQGNSNSDPSLRLKSP